MVEGRYSRASVSDQWYFVECKQSYFTDDIRSIICWKVQLSKQDIRKEDFFN